MPDDNELGALFGASTRALPPIDVDAVLKRSRRRRLPRQIATGIALTAAFAGIAVGGFAGLTQLTGMSSSGSASSVAGGTAGDKGAVTPETAPSADSTSGPSNNVCGSHLVLPAQPPMPKVIGLALSFPDAAVGSEEVDGLVTITNRGRETITVSGGEPTVYVARDGIVVWHSDESVQGKLRELTIKSGDSATILVKVTPEDCSRVGNDNGGAVSSTLPKLTAGTYSVWVDLGWQVGVTVGPITSALGTLTLR